MFRLIAVVVIALVLAACQHTGTGTEAYRIGRIIMEPSNLSGSATISAALHSSLQVAANDINAQLPASAPTADLHVRLDKVRYVSPKGPLMFGRSHIKGKIHANSPSGGTTYRFSATDDGQPGLNLAFDTSSFFALKPTSQRLANNVATAFSRYYARSYGTKALRHGDVTKRAGIPRTAAPVGPHRTPPPPLVLVAQ
ncbi:hypothetical protein [Breoghania sp.]|uniref:hypothetical protein n=1 Tax=Breoghania sp. TaxID=2065378 RepID=UPI0029C9B9E8|nr:hypothetical protein [Breoghania sp.]